MRCAAQIGHDKAEAVEDDPGDDDALQPGTGLINRAAGSGEIHHEESHRCGDNGRNRRDSKDLRINILHDFACFLPNCGR